MGYIYTMSDVHGSLDAFLSALELVDFSADNKLVLLGDYIHGPDSFGVLKKIMQMQDSYGRDKVIALLGNHEEFALSGEWPIGEDRAGNVCVRDDDEEKYLAWMKTLPRVYEEGNTIFVHAGIDEEAGEWWKWGADETTFTQKTPPQTGKFHCGDREIKIVAGHIGTASISGDPDFHDIYFDGESHYYIDGTTLFSGVLPIIKVDTKNDRYYRVTESGDWPILPYHEEY